MFIPGQSWPTWQGNKGPFPFLPYHVVPHNIDVPFYSSSAGARRRGYGADEALDTSQTTQTTQLLTTLLPSALESLTSGVDPRVQVKLYEAKIKNMRQMKRTIPALAWFYDNQIRKLEAKRDAAKSRLALKEESESSWRVWRGLGQAGAGVGLVVGVGVAALLLSAAVKNARRT